MPEIERGASDKYWVVSVTYGNKPHQEYASVPSEESAKILARDARNLGYRNVRVVNATVFLKEKENRRQRTADQGRTPSTVPGVRDMRAQPEVSLARQAKGVQPARVPRNSRRPSPSRGLR